jgi:hypothetical protein
MADSPKKKIDDKLLLTLACGATVESAAREAGVSARTVYRRLEDPAFSRQLQALRADTVLRTCGALTAAGTEAVRTLIELMKPTVAANTRLGAARAVLESGVRLREITELEARIAALEQRLGPAEGDRQP